MRIGLIALVLSGIAATITPATLRADDHYYEDREHHDRHVWNDAEARAWRHWLVEERHMRYHEWLRATARERRDYWRWRHEHMDWR